MREGPVRKRESSSESDMKRIEAEQMRTERGKDGDWETAEKMDKVGFGIVLSETERDTSSRTEPIRTKGSLRVKRSGETGSASRERVLRTENSRALVVMIQNQENKGDGLSDIILNLAGSNQTNVTQRMRGDEPEWV